MTLGLASSFDSRPDLRVGERPWNRPWHLDAPKRPCYTRVHPSAGCITHEGCEESAVIGDCLGGQVPQRLSEVLIHLVNGDAFYVPGKPLGEDQKLLQIAVRSPNPGGVAFSVVGE